MNKKLVILINPPNSSTLFNQSQSVGSPTEHSDWSNYPAAGVLMLASSLKAIPNVQPVYLDGVVCPIDQILDFIIVNRQDIAAIGISTLTDTYKAGLKILEYSRNINPDIVHIVGNDHFSALPMLCMKNQSRLIDYGMIGNEVIKGFTQLIDRIVNGKDNDSADAYPGVVSQRLGCSQIHSWPQRPEPVFSEIDYRLIDEVYPHTQEYDRHFRASLPGHMKKWFDCGVSRGIPIEIARGCIKFRDDNSCSFCSIQYGGMWRNSVPNSQTAWNIIEKAHQSGYDYFYITADELSLTFRQLLLDMKNNKPDWIRRLPLNQRPIMTGYARSDGLILRENAELLYNLGFRLIMVGVDAGPILSLKALNKHLTLKNEANRLEQLYEANLNAFDRAYEAGLKLRVGFVVGHLGMTKELLAQNVNYFCNLISNHPKAVSIADIEILSPEPGSKEYEYLTDPIKASEKAQELGLSIADDKTRNEIAEKWKRNDIINREELIRDYAAAFMPDLTLQELISARIKMRDHCRDNEIVIGDA